MYFALKLQELFYCESRLFYYLTKQIATYRVATVNRNRCHAFRYRMKIILVAPMRLCILKLALNRRLNTSLAARIGNRLMQMREFFAYGLLFAPLVQPQ